MSIIKVLGFEEGYRERPYIDSLGYPTVAIGKRIGPKGADIKLYDFKVSRLMADLWLEEEVTQVARKANTLPWYKDLSDDRKVIIQSMIYNMGFVGVLKFKKMIAALESHNWKEAQAQALDSIWAKQVPKRADRHARVLSGESIEKVYAGLL